MTANRQRIGFFGGTFDPIHHGHLILASYAASSAGLDRLLFAPVAVPPHKDRKITDIASRTAMLLLAIERDARFDLTTVDLDREGPHYSADTLAILSDRFPQSDLFFLMGSDSYRDLPRWHEPARIFEHAKLLVGKRPNSSFDQEALWEALPPARTHTEFVDIPLIEISSTEIRRRVSDRLPIDYLVPRRVQDYIQANELYLDAVEVGNGRQIFD